MPGHMPRSEFSDALLGKLSLRDVVADNSQTNAMEMPLEQRRVPGLNRETEGKAARSASPAVFARPWKILGKQSLGDAVAAKSHTDMTGMPWSHAAYLAPTETETEGNGARSASPSTLAPPPPKGAS